MISTGLAMAIAAMVSTAFFQTRRAIARAEVQLALADEAQVIYLSLEASLSSLQQSCALVAITTQSDGSGATDPGRVSLLFMRGNEQKDNYTHPNTGGTATGAGNKSLQSFNTSQIVWEEWQWRRATRTIHAGVNRPMRRIEWEYNAREFTVPSSFMPGGGVDYQGKSFLTVPQPRRTLDPADPIGGPVLSGPPVSRLDDNLWFPDPADTRRSLVSNEDVGDYSDLQKAIAPPSFSNVSDFAWQIVPHDETLPVLTLDDSTGSTRVLQGVWLDGRLGTGAGARDNATLAPPQDFAGSDAAQRPKLIRLRFTLTEPKTRISQTFSFSFSLPGFAPAG